MATGGELTLVIGADVSGAVTGAAKVERALDKVNKTAQKSGKDFTGLSRIIQDLPYGFNAISNNLTQVVSSAGGLGLAISAVTAAITFVNIGFGAWTRGLKSNKTAIEDNKKALEEQRAALEKTYEAAGQQLAQVAKLIEISKLETTTRGQQVTILKQLKDINKEYFNDLKVEGNTIVGLNEAYQGYYNNILKVARAKGAEESISALTKKLLAVKDSTLTLDRTFTNLNLTTKQTAAFLQGTTGTPFEKFGQASERVQGILNKMLPTLEDFAYLTEITGLSMSQINQILGDRRRLMTDEERIQAQILSNSKLIAQVEQGSVTDTKEKTKAVKKLYEGYRTFDPNIVKGLFNPRAFFDTFPNVNKIIQNKLDKGPSLRLPRFNIEDSKNLILEATETIRSTLEGALEGIAEGIGNLFSGERNPFSGFLNVIGSGLKEIGKQLITLGGLGQLVQKALASIFTNPTLAIVAGVAAIAIGSVISNLANSGIKAFASGGVVTSPTLALVGERGPERITPLGYEGTANNVMNGEVVFTISGQQLRGVLNRIDQSNRYTF